MNAPIDSANLSKCQQEPLALSTFYRYFIQWFIDHYDDIVKLLNGWLQEHRNKKRGVHARLSETYFCLSSAYRLFLQYCHDCDFISQSVAQGEYTGFCSLLMKLVSAQNKRVNEANGEESKRINVLNVIKGLLNSEAINLAKDAKHFRVGVHDGVVHNGALCIRREKLEEVVKRVIPSATIDDIVNSLLVEGALRLVSDKRTIQINACGNRRFYAIPLNKLR